MKLEDKAEELFGAIEPHLRKKALKHRVQDPQGEALSFYAKYIEIIRGIDEGRYLGWASDMKEGIARGETPGLFIAYMVKSFANELLAQNRRDSHKAPPTVLPTVHVDLNPEDAYHDAMQHPKISDLVELVETELHRSKKNITTVREKVNVLFLKAMVSYFAVLDAELGNTPIVRNYKANKSKDFFIIEVRESHFRTKFLVEKISELITLEDNPRVIKVSKRLLGTEDDRSALNQRISRYYSKLPARLRRAHERGRGIEDEG